MNLAGGTKRFLETTRGRIVALLRRGARTVEDLAQALGLTDNAIRSHLAALERDGLVQQEGSRRRTGAGKPALVYGIHPEVEPLFSRAYAPVLSALLDELAEQIPQEHRDALLRAAGRRLAGALPPAPAGGLEARVPAATALLHGLGAEVETERGPDGLTLRGVTGCPLSAAVSRRPELCQALAALLSEFLDAEVRECCQRGERPRCCFEVRPAVASGG
jgi:predicted ArsR family transcriptional regulator